MGVEGGEAEEEEEKGAAARMSTTGITMTYRNWRLGTRV